jgi:release factor glutamine methyltransferase
MKFLEYSIKKISFDNCVFYVPVEVYEPAEDTFLIAENLDTFKNDSVLDVGTGCGILAVLAAKKARSVIATDINPHSIRYAIINSTINGVGRKVIPVRGDLLKPFRKTVKFDLILFNAPYLPIKEPKVSKRIDWLKLAWSGGNTGRRISERFIDEASKHLEEGGRIMLIQSSLSSPDTTIQRFENLGMYVEQIAEKKVDFETILLLRATFKD